MAHQQPSPMQAALDRRHTDIQHVSNFLIAQLLDVSKDINIAVHLWKTGNGVLDQSAHLLIEDGK